MDRPGRVVVLAGGSPHAHDFGGIGRALTDLLGDRAVLVASPDEATAALGGADVLVVDGLWWRMLGDAYDRWRPDHAYSPSAAVRSALTDFVAGGGGLVALHTAVICFDDWPGWGALLGGTWRWGVSSHPPLGPVVARVVGTHPVVDGLGPSCGSSTRSTAGSTWRRRSRCWPSPAARPTTPTNPSCGPTATATAAWCSADSATTQRRSATPANARLIAQATAWAARRPTP